MSSSSGFFGSAHKPQQASCCSHGLSDAEGARKARAVLRVDGVPNAPRGRLEELILLSERFFHGSFCTSPPRLLNKTNSGLTFLEDSSSVPVMVALLL